MAVSLSSRIAADAAGHLQLTIGRGAAAAAAVPLPVPASCGGHDRGCGGGDRGCGGAFAASFGLIRDVEGATGRSFVGATHELCQVRARARERAAAGGRTRPGGEGG